MPEPFTAWAYGRQADHGLRAGSPFTRQRHACLFQYNEAFFLSPIIVMIPAIAMFILNVETQFFEHYGSSTRIYSRAAGAALKPITWPLFTASSKRRNLVIMQAASVNFPSPSPTR